MIIINILLILTGFAGVIAFILPFLSNRILNVGNLTGLLVFGCIFLYGIFFKYVNRFIKYLWNKNKFGKIVVIFVNIIIVLAVVIVLAESIMMYRACKRTSKENATLIVLGCKVNGDRPSLMLMERIDAAYEYLIENPETDCIVSGGKGVGENISEAECMKRELVKKGIDEDRIYMEDKSVSTKENIEFSYNIIKENKLTADICIATNEFHEYRAMALARKYNKSAGAKPAKTAWWLFPTFYVRELGGITASKIAGLF